MTQGKSGVPIFISMYLCIYLDNQRTVVDVVGYNVSSDGLVSWFKDIVLTTSVCVHIYWTDTDDSDSGTIAEMGDGLKLQRVIIVSY